MLFIDFPRLCECVFDFQVVRSELFSAHQYYYLNKPSKDEHARASYVFDNNMIALHRQYKEDETVYFWKINW